MGFLITIFLMSCFFSFGVQMIYYFAMLKLERKFIKTHQNVFNYLSGVIGDFFLVPLLNIFAVLVIRTLSHSISISLGMLAIISGVLTTFIFHFCQQKFSQINWTMPENGLWNVLGLYHAIFMFFESTFLWYVVFSYLKIGLSDRVATTYFGYGLLVTFLFFITFLIDYRHVYLTRKEE